MAKTVLKIGGHHYQVIHTDHIDDSGKIDRERGIIYINKNLQETEKLCTTIHEVLHAINSELTETTTEFLSQALTQVIIDNKLHDFGTGHRKKWNVRGS